MTDLDKYILIIDDDLEDIELMSLAVEDALQGYMCKGFTYVPAAIHALKQSPLPRLILLDLNMPCVHVLQLLRQIQEIVVDKNVQLVVQSGAVPLKSTLDAIHNLGARFFVKPFTFDGLRKYLHSLLTLHASHEHAVKH